VKTTVSIRGQTVVPQEIREKMGIVPQSRLDWQIKDGLIVVTPIPPDPVRASVGILEGRGLTTEDLLTERKKERQRERDEEST
jgi:AbrB family looped-hinge helix DNA binding protein